MNTRSALSWLDALLEYPSKCYQISKPRVLLFITFSMVSMLPSCSPHFQTGSKTTFMLSKQLLLAFMSLTRTETFEITKLT